MRNSKLWLGLSVALEVWSDSTGGAAASKSVRQAADADSAGFSPHEWTIINTLSPLPDLPVDPTNKYRDSAAAALLGQKLFFEPRVSGPIQQGTPAEGQLGAIGEKYKIACRNCHMPESKWLFDIRSNNGGGVPRATAPGGASGSPHPRRNAHTPFFLAPRCRRPPPGGGGVTAPCAVLPPTPA